MIIYHKSNPARFLISGFAFIVLLGTFFLLLPQSTVTPGSIPLVDALFTSTSAVCVTGLTVLDVSSSYTLLGQIVIMCLIQVGGIGIVFFSVLFNLVFVGRMGIGQKSMFSSTMMPRADWDIVGVLKVVALFTLLMELIGACFMYFPMARFLKTEGMKPFYYALFHSVSAFCNAGFSHLPNNLADVRFESLVTIPIMALIVIGGIGFFVVDDLIQFIRFRGKHTLTLHTKIVLITTIILILVGALLSFALEYNNTLKGVSLSQKIIDSFFLSITSRTAGFNTISIGELSNPTIFIVIILMFIGASPASTGGGVKTSSIAILFMLVFSRYKGMEDTSLFKKTIPKETISNAQAIIASALTIIILGVLGFLVSELYAQSVPLTNRDYFVSSIFEVVSAFGTVGLSMGITPHLNTINKLIIIVIMFIGRVGPLTIFIAMKYREHGVQYRYSEENVMVG